MTNTIPTEQLTRSAKQACLKIANLNTDTKNQVLLNISKKIKENSKLIEEQNRRDVDAAQELVNNRLLSKPLLDRLILTPEKIAQLSTYLEEVAKQKDPVGEKLFAMQLAEGLELERISCPIGLIAIIFESRPEVVIQVTALSLKSGNSAILKGGTEATYSNRVLFQLIDSVLSEFNLEGTVNLIETREDVEILLKRDTEIDLIIPRGSNDFVRYIQNNTKIPVLGHSSGICHIYIDREYEKTMITPVVLDAKLDYPSACNALETLLIHEEAAKDVLPELLMQLTLKGVQCRGCERSISIAALNGIKISEASEEDWRTEYTDLVLSIRIINSIDEAIDHINHYGSHHTDAIITTDDETASRFLKNVDSACVFHNASTRFSDGYVFGLGAEVGISTNKTHSRGPVGLDGMIIYKYILRGSGHQRSSFSGCNAEPFIHLPLPLKQSS